MIRILKVTPDDEELIVPFLAEQFKSGDESYRRLFKFAKLSYVHGNELPPMGSCLKNEEGKILGYLGCLAHRSSFHDNRWIVNLSSWAVHPQARAYSMKLLNHFLEDNTAIFTNFSATKQVQQILQRFGGFTPIDDGELTYSVFPHLIKGLFAGTPTKTGNSALKYFSGTPHEKIIKDHLQMGGIIMSPAPEKAFIFFKRKLGWYYALHLMHVINFDAESFSKSWAKICFLSFFKYNAIQLFIDGRYAPARIKYTHKKERMMFAKGLQEGQAIPTRAYSEPLQFAGKF